MRFMENDEVIYQRFLYCLQFEGILRDVESTFCQDLPNPIVDSRRESKNYSLT